MTDDRTAWLEQRRKGCRRPAVDLTINGRHLRWAIRLRDAVAL